MTETHDAAAGSSSGSPPPSDANGSIAGRVILTHARSLHALVAARSLARRGLEVIGCDDMPMTAMAFSRYATQTFLTPPSHADPDAWLDALQDEALRRRPKNGSPFVLMPLHRNTRLVASARDRFEPWLKVAAPQIMAIDAVQPKHHLIETCERCDVPTPRTWRVWNHSHLDGPERADAFPLFVKLPDGTGGAGIRKVSGSNELRRACDEMLAMGTIGPNRPLLVQAGAPGEDYCFTGLFDRGRLVASMTYQNDRTFPADHGFGVLRRTVDGEPLRPFAERLMQALDWTGVAELDFRWTARDDDPPQLIEVNPRFWGGLFQSVESGVDSPWLLFRQTIGERLDPQPGAQLGTRTRVPMLDWVSTLSQLRVDDPNVWRKLESAWSESRGVPSEIVSTDDRSTALGAFYVVGALLRHGKLPEEFQREDHSPPAGAWQGEHDRVRRNPRVLISMDRSYLHWLGLDHFCFRRLIRRANGRTRFVRYDQMAKHLEPHDARLLVESVDALMLGGGGDVDPSLYGSNQTARGVKPERDRFELALIEQAVRLGKPILGICRGCQLLNVAFGGTLMNLSGRDRGGRHRRLLPHPVMLRDGSRIARLAEAGRIAGVRSIHRQAVDRPGHGVSIVGRAADGVAEAIESDRGWYVGVQWHPEWMIFKNEGHRIIDGFVEAASHPDEVGDRPAAGGARIARPQAAATHPV